MSKVQDINEHSVPAGGWQYRVPQTNWSVPNPVSVTLNQATKLVVEHLRKNPAVVAKHKLDTDYDAVKKKIMDYTRTRLGIKVAASFPQAHSRASVVAAVGGKISRLASGFGVLSDWLGAGGTPVSAELAERRAQTCAICPRNEQGGLDRWFTIPASAAIRKQIESRKDLKLATSVDEKLNICGACLCPLKTKVHTPLTHVLKHLKDDVRAELPDHCWMIKEK